MGEHRDETEGRETLQVDPLEDFNLKSLGGLP